jgi:phosphoenolpyruvate carboxylase
MSFYEGLGTTCNDFRSYTVKYDNVAVINEIIDYIQSNGQYDSLSKEAKKDFLLGLREAERSRFVKQTWAYGFVPIQKYIELVEAEKPRYDLRKKTRKCYVYK